MAGALDVIRAESSVIEAAPVSFLVCVAVVTAIAFILVSRLKAQQIADLESRLTLRNDEIADYRRKLDGASPDVAKARLDALELQYRELIQRVGQSDPRLTFRTLSQGQRSRMIEVLGTEGGSICISTDAEVTDAKAFGDQFADVFHISGWRVEHAFVMGLNSPPPCGLALWVENTASLKPDETRLANALRAAELEFEVRPGFGLQLVISDVLGEAIREVDAA